MARYWTACLATAHSRLICPRSVLSVGRNMPRAGPFDLREDQYSPREKEGELTLSDITEKMKDIDFCMLTTVTDGGKLSGRPMSNNRDVEYDGDYWFFAYDSARFIQNVQANDQVGLTFAGDKSLLGKPVIFIAVEGKASLTKDRLAFEEHWVDDMERWFPQGIETPGIVLLRVHASRVHYWDGGGKERLRFDGLRCVIERMSLRSRTIITVPR